jgi:N-acetylmuramoyl-L-alanine amidase
MKFLFALTLCLAMFAGAAHGEVINGRTYVSLSGWGRANGFGGFTQNRGGLIFLTNKTTRLMFDVDSTEVKVNGVNVRLGYPVAKGGLIAQFDIDKTIRPLVFAQKPSPKKITTICLDPGHGGRDPGFRVGWVFTRSEKNYTLLLAQELRDQLVKAGYNVIFTRDRDVYPELAVRADIANRRNADLLVSLHFNSFSRDPKSVQGAETYCMTPFGAASSNDSAGAGAGSRAYPGNRVDDKSLLLAYQVQRALVKNLGAVDRDVRRARFEVLRSAEMPSILVEAGYMSHPDEGKKIFSVEYRKLMAAAIVRGIKNYQQQTSPAVTKAETVKPKPAPTKKAVVKKSKSAK